MSSVLEDIDLGTIEVLEDEPEVKDEKEFHLYDYESWPLSLCEKADGRVNPHKCKVEWMKGTSVPDSCPHCGAPLCEPCRTVHDIRGL